MEVEEYEITVSTSGRLYAGTDARVFIKLFAAENDSDEIELKDETKGKKMFESGSNDKFNIKVKKDLGVIYKIKIRHDDSGYFSGWHLNKLCILSKETGRQYHFECNRWLAKDEGDKKIEIELESKGLAVVKLDQLNTKNRSKHNTGKFKEDKFIIRRGESFFVNLHLARPFNNKYDFFHIILKTGERPREFNKSMIYIGKVDEFDSMKQKWAFKIVKAEEKLLHLEINCPFDAMPSKYEMTLENDDHVNYKHPNDIFILFNPWCRVDDAYMEDEESKKEYVLRQHGCIFIGSSSSVHPRNWYFGQFEDISLECAFELLNHIPTTKRDNPVDVSRGLSSLINSCDNRGLLVGNWSDNYDGGKAPTYWTSSPPIFEEYMKTKSSVKFGQCWVFSALFTSVLRTLGIPCRCVTNFNSAHDTDISSSMDIFLDEEGNKIKEKSADSIWNFHCWNDAWMTRSDLQPGYGGWQAVDATPQERSQGLYQMGPCSLRSIKEGEINMAYDCNFATAEVNSDVMFWQKDEKSNVWEVVQINRTHVGKKISTKQIGSFNIRQDISNDYKFPERSILERASVRKALEKSGNIAIRSRPKFIEMKVKPVKKMIEIGGDLEVDVFVKNLDTAKRIINVVIGGNIVRYNGVVKGELNHQKHIEEINGNEEKPLRFVLKATEYMKHLSDQSMIRYHVTVREKEFGQICTASKVIEVKRPDLKFNQMPNGMELEKEETFSIQFENPFDEDLTECQLHLDGTLMEERFEIACGNFSAKKTATIPVKITPNTTKGLKSLLATFNSKELKGLHASIKINVI